MKTDTDLLGEFASRRDEASFRELVGRHIGLVYAVNLRRLRDVHLAQEATQSVFIALARKAPDVARSSNLVGWLHRSSCYESRNLMRAQINRMARESEAERLGTTTAGAISTGDHGRVDAVLDEILDELPETDREAILARYFSGRSFAEIGAATGRTENAARMRVDRALARLRDRLERRGFQSTAAVLAGMLPAYAAAAVPAGLATTVANTSLATAGAAAASVTILTYMTTTKIMTTAAVLAVAGFGGYAAFQNHELQGELKEMRQQQANAAAVVRSLEQQVGALRASPAAPTVPSVAGFAPTASAGPAKPAAAEIPGLTKVAPVGWHKNGSKPKAFDVGVDPSHPFGGVPSAYVKAVAPDAEDGFGGMMQSIATDQYKNRRVRLTGWIKTQGAGGGGNLWLRVDGQEPGKNLGFDNMDSRAPKGTTDWEEYSLVLDVPAEASRLNYGFFLGGSGQMWVSGVNVEVVGSEVPTTNMNVKIPPPPTAPVNLSLSPASPSGG